MSGHHKTLTWLLDARVHMRAVDHESQTVLMHTISGSNLEMTKFLLSLEADVDAINCQGETALMLAAKQGKLDILRE